MCETRTGAILAGGAAIGKTGREPSNKLAMPRGSPRKASPEVAGPNPVTCGGPSSLAGDISFGIRVGILKVMSTGLLGAAIVFAPARVLGAGGSPKGRPKLTGVESEWNRGKPAGRSSGTTSNTPTANTCKPSDVKVVNPRRERSSHDEWIVASNIVSS
jgi:hypothetical protein